jgi:glycogen operon protein
LNSDQYSTRTGVRYPHGIKTDDNGVNFSIFSRHATRVELLLFSAADSAAPFQTILLDPEKSQTFFAWHVYVEELPVGTWYAWRIDGPGNTRTTGHRFDPDKVLLDPSCVPAR